MERTWRSRVAYSPKSKSFDLWPGFSTFPFLFFFHCICKICVRTFLLTFIDMMILYDSLFRLVAPFLFYSHSSISFFFLSRSLALSLSLSFVLSLFLSQADHKWEPAPYIHKNWKNMQMDRYLLVTYRGGGGQFEKETKFDFAGFYFFFQFQNFYPFAHINLWWRFAHYARLNVVWRKDEQQQKKYE